MLRARRPHDRRASRTGTSRSRAGSRATSPRPRASPSRTSRSSTTGSPPDAEPEPYAGDEPRFLCIGRLIPIKGHVVLLRAFAEAREERAGARARHRRPRPARARPQGARARARRSTTRCASSATSRRSQRAIERRGDRRRALARRGLRDGRARGDGARTPGDRGRRSAGSASSSSTARPACSSRPATPSRSRAALVTLASDPALRRAMGEAGRARALERFAEDRCTRADRAALPRVPERQPAPRAEPPRAAARSTSRKSQGTR